MATPRSLWNGTIVFGLVRVSVKLYTATQSSALRFHERHAGDGGAIEHRRVCVAEDTEVPYSEVGKGYTAESGRELVLSAEDLAAAGEDAPHVVEIEHFVRREEIDPIFFADTYYLGPGVGEDNAYRLLREALRRCGRVGIGHFVFRGRERLAAVRELDDVIALHTMRFAAEVIDGASLAVEAPSRAPSKPERDAAEALVKALAAPFDPGAHGDVHRAALLALIERKAGGEEITPAAVAEPSAPDDLLAALHASLAQQRPPKRRPPSRTAVH